MKNRNLIIILIATMFCLTSCGNSDYEVEIEHEDYCTSYVYSDSIRGKSGYHVTVKKEFDEHTRVTKNYLESAFVLTKGEIVKTVCKLKERITKQRNIDESISKEIDSTIELIESENCDSS